MQAPGLQVQALDTPGVDRRAQPGRAFRTRHSVPKGSRRIWPPAGGQTLGITAFGDRQIGEEMASGDARFVVGIDLGTTNCAVAHADLLLPEGGASDVPLLQVAHPGTVEERAVLPSFLYLPGAHELADGAIALPWRSDEPDVVGVFARDQGARVPHRVVASAKSWLCTEVANRRGPILPWKAPPEVPRLSPVEVSTRYLGHIRDAWNAAHPDELLEKQEIVLTVPASFDAVARELTAEAARAAGLGRLTLLEEPQAALYAWLDAHGDRWRKQVKVGDLILVCDVGGGTTDFSLIAVAEEAGNLVLERLAVGDHILLGGDNMDLALAVHVGNRLKTEGYRLDTWQFQMLVHACRRAKERLLEEDAPQAEDIVLEGRGTRLIGASIKTRITRQEVEQVVLEGFLPLCAVTDRAQRRARTALAELGLPYESDAAISRHLATFLGNARAALKHGDGPSFAPPSVVLFNGGVMKAPLLRRRILDVIEKWLADEGVEAARELSNVDLDRAVARGAAHYGTVRHGCGIRIRGGTSRAYYVGVEVARPAVPGMPIPLKALCVASLGMEEGTSADLPSQDFGLVVGEPAEFRFLASSHRRDDAVGAALEEWDENELEEIATLAVELKAGATEVQGQLVPVRLRSVVTEVGTLELWCVEQKGEGRWKLEFDVRERQDAL